jgi:hypothetical protein
MKSAQVLSSSSPIIGIDIWDSFVLMWSETKAELFNIQESGTLRIKAFPVFLLFCIELQVLFAY